MRDNYKPLYKKNPPGTPLDRSILDRDGNPMGYWDQQFAAFDDLYYKTTLGEKFFKPIGRHARYAGYGVAALALTKLVSYANNLYTWWAGSKNSRERARLERKLDRLNDLLGPNVDLVELIREEHSRPKRRRRVARSRSRSRSRTRSRTRSRRRGHEDQILSHMSAADKKALLRVAAILAENDLDWDDIRANS